jgi:hypothetical protein
MKRLSLVLTGLVFLAACGKDDDKVTIPPAEGSTVTLNGGTGGASAENAAYIDMSTGTATGVKRSSWDLGFYSGSDFRVILNNTTSAGAKMTTATSLAAVGAADTIGLTLAINQVAPGPDQYAFFDPIDGSLTNTVIPAVSATAAENRVVIINRGTGGGTAARAWIKALITRNGNGYTVQFGGIQQTSGFTTVQITKDADYHFRYLSFDGGGTIVNVQPKKAEWDFTWGYSVYEIAGVGPYNFSDLISTNSLSGVMVGTRIYASAAVRNEAYTKFNRDSVNATVSTFSASRWAIGSSWRVTPAPGVTNAGVRTDRFYVIKDVQGNYYKLKFISFAAEDGGERGKPVFEYALIP